jgi:hypothetical protein
MDQTDPHEKNFTTLLEEVMLDDDYLVGSEPSGCDFSDWPCIDFTQDNENEVLREKFFQIPTFDERVLSMQIIQVNPDIYKIGNHHISFIIRGAKSDTFPIIILGTSNNGEEVILTSEVSNERSDSDINNIFPNIERVNVRKSEEASSWGLFIKEVISSKQFIPALFTLTDNIVRDDLDMSPNEEVTEEARRYARCQELLGEVLGLLYADYRVKEI